MSTTEDVLDPQLALCDPHHHLMDNEWIRYGLDDLMADLRSGHRVTHTMYMECGNGYRTTGPEALRPVGETQMVMSVPAPPGVMAGMVGFADLRLGDAVGEVLDAHLAAGGARFRGVRFMAAADPDPQVLVLPYAPAPGVMRDPQFQRGVAQVQRRGLPLDLWVYSPQLEDVIALARAFPDQVFVLDHLGSPLTSGGYDARRDEVFAQWRGFMREVARCPNVMLKVGGIAMHAYGAPWQAGEPPPSSEAMATFWRDDVNRCFDWFGPARCMFESNFPVDRLTVDYVRIWNAFKRLAQPLSAAERAGVCRDNAIRIYALAD
ncbi:MAG: amidohydrolase [Gammaproteobacteria bacterium]